MLNYLIFIFSIQILKWLFLGVLRTQSNPPLNALMYIIRDFIQNPSRSCHKIMNVKYIHYTHQVQFNNNLVFNSGAKTLTEIGQLIVSFLTIGVATIRWCIYVYIWCILFLVSIRWYVSCRYVHVYACMYWCTHILHALYLCTRTFIHFYSYIWPTYMYNVRFTFVSRDLH